MNVGTITAIVGAIVGVISAISAIIGWLNRNRLGEIHILVNSRLDVAIKEIEDLKNQRDIKAAETNPEKTLNKQ